MKTKLIKYAHSKHSFDILRKWVPLDNLFSGVILRCDWKTLKKQFVSINLKRNKLARFAITLLLTVCCCGLPAVANENKRTIETFTEFLEHRVDSYLISQIAGYSGLVAFGAGSDFGHYWTTDLMIGFVPEAIGGENLWSITFKNTIHPESYLIDDDFSWRPIYLGVSVIYSLDKNTFVNQPDKYPDEYYPPTGLVFSPLVGTMMKYKNHAAFIEIASLSYYREQYETSTSSLDPVEIHTFGFGYKYYFDVDHQNHRENVTKIGDFLTAPR